MVEPCPRLRELRIHQEDIPGLVPPSCFRWDHRGSGRRYYAVLIGTAPTKPAAIETPIAVRLSLKPEARDWKKVLGGQCALDNVRAVAVAGTLSSPEVVTSPTAGCRAARFTVGKKQGVAVPVVRQVAAP